jgi:hypothetical protein
MQYKGDVRTKHGFRVCLNKRSALFALLFVALAALLATGVLALPYLPDFGLE